MSRVWNLGFRVYGLGLRVFSRVCRGLLGWLYGTSREESNSHGEPNGKQHGTLNSEKLCIVVIYIPRTFCWKAVSEKQHGHCYHVGGFWA